ncbi:MAG: RNase J family beta-CASP ribonuclease [Candidatus Woesearchaeota archaeon]
MKLEICTVGGYNEVGKNMTAIKYGKEAVIFDMGLHMEKYIDWHEDNLDMKPTAKELEKEDAIPDDRFIKDWRGMVKVIVPTHAHLDHVGAIPYMSNRYDAPIVCTPYTAEVIKAIIKDDKFKLNNSIKVMNANSTYKISDNLTLEFINVTHSTPQTVMAALHTPEGIVLYANDFKFDNFPTLGKKPNFKRLSELGEKGIKLLIVDGTRATREGKTPSESVAKEMLRDVLIATESKGKIVVVTTFSSHLARLKTIVEFGRKMNREVIFMGRSLAKYVEAGEAIGIVNFSDEVEILKYSRQVRKKLKQINRDRREKYLLVMTGHQGEPGAVLSRILHHELAFDFEPDDHVVFSCSVIPNPTNIANRQLLENKLKKAKVRIFKDIHTSGHASKEDLRDLINMVKPEHIIPAHGDFTMTSALSDLAVDMGYRLGHNVHIMRNGQRLEL